MSTKILLNGAGRIGKAILKQLLGNKDFEIIIINDINPYIENIVYSINYDSTYGKLDDKFQITNTNLIENKTSKIKVTNHNSLNDIDLTNIDIIIDSSGKKEDIATMKSADMLNLQPYATAQNCFDAMLEKYDFHDMVVSIKSSDVLMCAEAYRLVADKINYPLHVGITEAGTVFSGNIKSAVGLGIILNQGIGDTIRVSLTGDPVNEIVSAKLILKTLGLRSGGIEVVSCPTCGRTNIDLIPLANQVETEQAEDDNPE